MKEAKSTRSVPLWSIRLQLDHKPAEDARLILESALEPFGEAMSSFETDNGKGWLIEVIGQTKPTARDVAAALKPLGRHRADDRPRAGQGLAGGKPQGPAGVPRRAVLLLRLAFQGQGAEEPDRPGDRRRHGVRHRPARDHEGLPARGREARQVAQVQEAARCRHRHRHPRLRRRAAVQRHRAGRRQRRRRRAGGEGERRGQQARRSRCAS